MSSLAIMSAKDTTYAPYPRTAPAPMVLTYMQRGQLIAPYPCPRCDSRTHTYIRAGEQPAACGRGTVKVVWD